MLEPSAVRKHPVLTKASLSSASFSFLSYTRKSNIKFRICFYGLSSGNKVKRPSLFGTSSSERFLTL